MTRKPRLRRPAAKKSPGPAGKTLRPPAYEWLLQRPASSLRYVLRLYIAGTTPRSIQAIGAVRATCERHLSGRFDLEVIDIYQQPHVATEQQIVAAPTLIKERPFPIRRMVGNLADQARLLAALNLAPESPAASASPSSSP